MRLRATESPRTRPREWLVCPTCGRSDVGRFCPECKMPLVAPAVALGQQTEPPSALQRRARKIKPQLAVGEPVRVARAPNEAEADMLAMILLDEGIPSLVRRSRGFDVPDFLAGGPREILVPQAAEELARELLGGRAVVSQGPAPVAPARLLAGLLVALGVGALVIWLLIVLTH